MTDPRIKKFAQILVDYSTDIQPGDRVQIDATLAALPLVEAIYERILERGGHPYPMLELPRQQSTFFEKAGLDQLQHINQFRKLAYDEFESRFRIQSSMDLQELKDVDPQKQTEAGKGTRPILEAQLRRGAAGEFKWCSTLFPTQAYADQAGMSLSDYEDFVYSAVYADKDNPIAEWKNFHNAQEKIIDSLKGGDKVTLKGPNVDLSLSIKDRILINCSGTNNMPDGEIFTGPVEDSLNGWVRYTYPAILQGRIVEGIELKFENGKVVHATADKNQDFLLQMINSDPGASYVGEFAIGTNYGIQQFTGSILFDEKIGGSFHIALGAGYPETGSKNKSQIHWDMICDIREDSEIHLDNRLVYKNGQFV